MAWLHFFFYHCICVSLFFNHVCLYAGLQKLFTMHKTLFSPIYINLFLTFLTFQQYMNWELQDVQAGFRKDRGTRDQIANICWIIKKARVPKRLLLLSRFSRVRLCATPQTAAHQLSLGFSRQEHWSGLPFPSPMHESEKWKWSRTVVSDPQRPHVLQPPRLLRPWDFPGKSTGVGCHHLLQKRRLLLQSWCTPFPIWNQSIVPCLVLTVASWPAYRFLRRQVRWSGIPNSLRIFHSLLWSIQSKALA